MQNLVTITGKPWQASCYIVVLRDLKYGTLSVVDYADFEGVMNHTHEDNSGEVRLDVNVASIWHYMLGHMEPVDMEARLLAETLDNRYSRQYIKDASDKSDRL